MKHLLVMVLLAFATTLFVDSLAQAEIVVAGYYKLGDQDPGAVAGQPVNAITVDSSTALRDMSMGGSGTTYTSDVAASAAACTGSNTSMSFTGTGYGYVTSTFTSDIDNFGMEGWFKISNPNITHAMVWNGNASALNGYGLYMANGTVQGYFASLALLDSGFAPTPNEWFYAAMVRDNGVTKLYINNTSEIIPSNSTVTPPAPNGLTVLASSVSEDALTGYADEVRVFTFAPNAFNATTDLLIVPEPSSLMLLALSALGLIGCVWHKRK